MRRPYDSLSVPLPEDVRKRVHMALIDDCRKTVAANFDRDQDLFMLRLQLEGVSQPGSTGPTPNSCQLEDNLPRELHTEAHANVCAAFRQKPYVTYDALQPQHDTQVGHLENLANSEAQLFGFDDALSTLSYIALEGRFAVCCVEYRTSQTKRKELRDVPVNPFETDENEPPAPPEQELWNVNDTTEEFEFRSVDPWDFYLSPAGKQTVESSDRVYERVWMSRSSLLDGVRNEGFDPDEIKELLKKGPTAVREGTDPRREQQSLQGVQEAENSFFECYRCTGRMPYVIDTNGENIVPDQFLDEDYVWYICPERQIVFKEIYRPYPVRQYATGHAIGPADQLIGHGIVSITSAIADEMTIMLRSIIDSVNFSIHPQMKVPENRLGYYSQKDVRQAGSFLPYPNNDPNSIQPVTRDFAGLQLGFEASSALYARAQRVVAAEGVNSAMAGKVRKAAEVEMTAQVLQNKFGLIVWNLSRMVQDIFRIYMAIRRSTLPENHTVRVGNEAQPITREDFDVPYRIVPHADPDNASSQARLQRDMAVINVLRQSPLYQQMIQMGNMDGEWLLMSHFLSHSGIQSPESIIGPAPQGFDANAVLRMILPIVMQGAQQGDQVAQAIIQVVQQRQQQGQMQPQMAGMAPGQHVSPGMGLNLPAIPGNPSAMQGAFGQRNGNVVY